MFGRSAGTKYAAQKESSDEQRGGGAEEQQQPNTKSAARARAQVRAIENHHPFTKKWADAADALRAVSDANLQEAGLVFSLDAHAHPTAPTAATAATLWEGDKLVSRCVLEEGKLNVTLRLLRAFKSAVATNAESADWLLSMAIASALPDVLALRTLMLDYEQSLGVLLACTLAHVEAVQTVDMPLLMAHASEVLFNVAMIPPADLLFDRTQECLVLVYLRQVFSRADDVGEDKLVALVLKEDLVPRVVALLHAHSSAVGHVGRTNGAAFLAHVFDTEDFSTHRVKFFADSATRSQLGELGVLFVDALVSETPALRRRLRPLLDEIARSTRNKE